jgi:hypothetical protein
MVVGQSRGARFRISPFCFGTHRRPEIFPGAKVFGDLTPDNND